MKNKICITIFILSLLNRSVYCQSPPTAHVSSDIQIFSSAVNQSEVSISINKTDPKNILVSANTITTTPTYNMGFYVSHDGGTTWAIQSDVLPGSASSGGDPSTAYDAAGIAYLTGLSATTTSYYGWPDGVLLQTSSNNGAVWTSQVRIDGTQTYGDDKEMTTTVDEMQTSLYANYYYCAWRDLDNGDKITIKRSTDGGVTFNQEHILSTRSGSGANVQTGPNGEIYVCWADWGATGTLPASNIGFAVSTNGGTSYSSSLPIAYTGIQLASNGVSATFNNTRINDFPSMAVDKSCGPNNGRIYIVYPVNILTAPNVGSTIVISYSDNQGTSWSSPLRIDDTNLDQSWFPWVSVDDETGVVSVAYYGYGAGSGIVSSPANTNTHVSYSTDGIHWGHLTVSSASHTPTAISGAAPGYAGDYIGIASFAGNAYAVWGDNRTGTWQVWFAKIHYDVPTLTSSFTNLQVCQPPVITGDANYEAADEIAVSNCGGYVAIDGSANVNMTAGQSIVISPGFSTTSGAVYLAQITPVTPCQTPGATFFKSNFDSWASDGPIIKQEVNGLKMFAYPSPASDFITVGASDINLNPASIIITDVAGRLVAQYNSPAIADQSIRQVIDVQSYSSGVYFVNIETNNQNHTIKFVKK